MSVPGDLAIDLAWLAPSASSLTALARTSLHAGWEVLRQDPALMLLLARTESSRDAASCDALLLGACLESLHLPGPIEWANPDHEHLRQACVRQAYLASRLAERAGIDARRAWMATMLAPLGWLAVAAVSSADRSLLSAAQQREHWGLDQTALARRLCHRWRLPAWLSAVVGQLGMHASIVERMGVDTRLFRLVQLAVLLARAEGVDLGLAVGGDRRELCEELGLAQDDVAAACAASEPAPALDPRPLSTLPLLPELLQLALDTRREPRGPEVEALRHERDQLQILLRQREAEEPARLQRMKLAALAELAAGAGHEINNPLAVISSQAQYILKQYQLYDGPADEIDNVAEYLDNLKSKVLPSLHKIIGQTQRVHGILTELMQFARPPAPRWQRLALDGVVRQAAEALRDWAGERRVRLVCPDVAADLCVQGDPSQLRAIISSLLRNAIEAAPPDGWASVRVEAGAARVEVIVEDNGAGPTPAMCEHLFDPFYSGRSAGRGRGLGLSTAWRLAQQHQGEVRFEGIADGLTRFVLGLPRAQDLAQAS